MNKTLLIVGGTFDKKGGKPSSLVQKIHNNIYLDKSEVTVYNGGYVSELHDNIIDEAKNHKIVIWMPSVPNDEIKIRNVKEVNPKTILISSKRNDNNKYSFAELISRSLAMKSNLTIEFSKVGDKLFNMFVFDPLGNEFYNGTSIKDMTIAIINRAILLTKFTRKPSIPAETQLNRENPNPVEFISFARSCSDIFHNLINPSKGTTRFLGNMSFRCQSGFPSFKDESGLVYVSRRNVDKSDIDHNSFVPVYLDDNDNVRYFGDNKPSVDTPVQLRLYKLFPNIKYMIHAHCYFGKDAIWTQKPVPCGAIEEVEEIVNALKNIDVSKESFIAVNLIGHGCLLMASDCSEFTNLMNDKNNNFIKRMVPEKFNSIEVNL